MSAVAIVVDKVKEHPFLVAGGVGAVILIVMLRGARGKATSTASSGAGQGVYAVGAAPDPNAAAIAAANITANSNIAMAQIAAQSANLTTQAQRDVQMTSANDALQAALASTSAGQSTTTAALAASIFGTAAAALTANNAGGAASVAAPAMTAQQMAALTGGTVAGAPGFLVPGGPGWQPWMTPHGGQNVPIWGNSPQTVAPASSGSPINTVNTQIEQLFNNVIRGGQGSSPLETMILTDAPAAPAPLALGPVQVGTAHVDPVFLDWTSNGLRSITDVTPGINNAFGFTGSYNPIGAAPATGATFH